jgi:hypothetical protein
VAGIKLAVKHMTIHSPSMCRSIAITSKHGPEGLIGGR